MIEILHGTHEAVIDGQAYTLREEDILITGSGILHRPPNREGECIIVQPAFSLLHNIDDLESVLSLITPALLITPQKDPDIHGRIRDLILEMKEEYLSQPPLAEAAVYYRLIEMFVLIGRKYNSVSKKFEGAGKKGKEYAEKFLHICRYINDHCTEDLTLQQVADLSGFSKYHFSRLFKDYTGINFYKYLTQKRIAYAEKLLADPQISVTETALRSGFNGLSTFIRMFRQVKGCTPTQFRNMHNN